jgi:hypothetical protein
MQKQMYTSGNFKFVAQALYLVSTDASVCCGYLPIGVKKPSIAIRQLSKKQADLELVTKQ